MRHLEIFVVFAIRLHYHTPFANDPPDHLAPLMRNSSQQARTIQLLCQRSNCLFKKRSWVDSSFRHLAIHQRSNRHCQLWPG